MHLRPGLVLHPLGEANDISPNPLATLEGPLCGGWKRREGEGREGKGRMGEKHLKINFWLRPWAWLLWNWDHLQSRLRMELLLLNTYSWCFICVETMLCVCSRCWKCGRDMAGKVPFEYYDYKFCSVTCLKEHRQHSATAW